MRIFVLAAPCAAMGLFVASCSSDQTSEATSSGTSSGSTGSSSSSSSSGAGGGAAGAVLDMFCNAMPAVACEADYTCCTNPMFQYPDADPSLENCKTSLGQSFFPFCRPNKPRSEFEAYLRAGTVVFDQAQFDSCMALLKAMSAGGAACVQPPLNVARTTCIRAFQGQLAPGEACPSGWPWYTNVLFCKDGSCENGVCVPFLKPGDACPLTYYPDTAESCNWVKGEWCYGDPQTGDAGAGDGGMAMGVCAPQGEIGDACHWTNAPPLSLECRSHNCDPVTSKCVLPDPNQSACDLIF